MKNYNEIFGIENEKNKKKFERKFLKLPTEIIFSEFLQWHFNQNA